MNPDAESTSASRQVKVSVEKEAKASTSGLGTGIKNKLASFKARKKKGPQPIRSKSLAQKIQVKKF